MRLSDFGDHGRLLDGLTEIASRAAAAILAVRDPAGTQRDKSDGSPVTDADHASEAEILKGLAQLLPGVPVASEEALTYAPMGQHGGLFALVDPLDGTRDFLAGETEYAVNIALMEDGMPVMGVIAAPAMGQIWRGIVGVGAERMQLTPGAGLDGARERRPIHTRRPQAKPPIAVVSRFNREHDTDALLAQLGDISRIKVGASIKFCRVAEGEADIYARIAPLAEWDIAAGHALVTAAGGRMTLPDGGPMAYGAPWRRVPGFVVTGDPASSKV